MKVILYDEIHGLGTRGDIVQVKDGYARNYLLPKKLAREATPGNLKSMEQERKKWALLAQEEQQKAQRAADEIKGFKVVVRKRVGESGTLYGSVTSNEIADQLLEKGIDIDKRRIELEHPIKSLGVHDVDIRLHRDVAAHIQVEVLPLVVETMGVPAAAAAAPARAAAPAPEAVEPAAEPESAEEEPEEE